MAKLRDLTEMPPMARGSAEEQLAELRDYLIRVIEELEYVLTHIEADNVNETLFERIYQMIPWAYTGLPLTDGTASAGTQNAWSRGDHRHGTDTSRAAAADLTSHVGDHTNPHEVTKTQVGLGNVDNVQQYSASNPPPIPTPAQVGAIPTTEKGSAGGVAELDANGMVPSAQLPSYVDDVLEYASLSAFPATGEDGKIYVALDTNRTYRWSGSAYTEISESLALGETASTAYRGDRGKAAYDHSQTTGNPHGTTAADIGAQEEITASGILKGDGAGGVTAAAAGTDYQAPLTFDATPTAGSSNPVTSEGIDTAIKARYTSTTLYTTLTDVHSDTTITMGDDFTNFKWLMIIFNTRSPASANYRMPLVIFTNAIPQGGFYPIINSEANGYVRINYVSGQTKQLRIQSTNLSALYIANIYGLT